MEALGPEALAPPELEPAALVDVERLRPLRKGPPDRLDRQRLQCPRYRRRARPAALADVERLRPLRKRPPDRQPLRRPRYRQQAPAVLRHYSWRLGKTVWKPRRFWLKPGPIPI